MPTIEQTLPGRTAIITVSYGSGEVLDTFLRTLRHYEGMIPVAVVDNKPDQENVQELSELYGATYVPLPSNPGYGAGMNAGVKALRDSHQDLRFSEFFFCNPDITFIEPVTVRLANSLRQAPTAGSIGPRLLNPDGSTYPSARNIPSVGTGIGHAFLSKAWPKNPWTRAYQNATEYAHRRSAGSLSGAAVMTTAEVFDRLDGWDEAYFMHFEDIDLGWRIGQLGLLNIYEPEVAVEHSGAHSTKKHAAQVEAAMTRSAIRFMGKRYSGFWNSPLRWSIQLGLRTRGATRLAIIRRAERNL